MSPTAGTREGLSFGPYNLLVRERLLTRDGAPVELGARAFDILIALVSRPNEVVSKKELLSQVWPDVTVEESSLRFHMAGLRKALGDGQDGARYITTLAGRGYCFVAPVSRSSEVRRADAAVESGFPQTNLPGRVMHMIGRDEDVLRISAHLIGARFVSIVGIGGVGKTTVAIAVGHHLFEAFAGAVLLVDLSALRYPSLVATTVASELGLSVQSEDATPAVIAYLRRKRMLVILDTCEHLIDAVAAFALQIYAKAPDVHLLTTSREVLQVEGEHVYRLDTLACPPEDSEVVSAAAQTFPAPRLFIERAAASGGGLELSDADVAIVVRICRKLDGVALAIELAARRVEAYGLQQTETLLDQRLLALLGHRGATPRQRTLQAALDWSYQLLSELERLVLRRLAVFVGHFTLDAAWFVVTGNDIDQSRALGAIESLVGKSMIVTRPIGAMMRYRLLDTTRAYVLNVAIDDAQAADLAMRHANYYRRWLDQRGSESSMLPTGAERSPYLAALNNARSALEWCFGEGGDVALGIELAAAAVPVFLAMSLLPECHRWSERAIRALDEAARGSPEEMQLQAALGVSLMFTRGGGDAARMALSRSLAIAEECGDVANQVGLLGALCLFQLREADFERGLHYAKRSQALAGNIENPAVIALAHSLLGSTLHLMGALADARTELEISLHHWSRFQGQSMPQMDHPSLAVILACTTYPECYASLALARTLWLQGYPAQSVERAHQLIQAAERVDHPTSRVVVLGWSAWIFVWTGDFGSAEKYINSCIALAESHSLAPYVALGHGLKAVVAIHRGDAKGGVEGLQASLGALHSRYKLPITLLNISLAEGLGQLGRSSEGSALIDETITSVRASQEVTFMPELLRVKGGLFLSMPAPNLDAAEACFAQSLESSRHQGARGWELRAAIDLARLWAKRGKPEEGLKLLQPIFEKFTEGQDDIDLQAAQRLLAELSKNSK
ncbi:MAG TPA: winged helix-turn-helix domain-containing protein [Xanthobacteraceae bacterium]|nr:winged helix-turn-helix domain-containing protein [Xanthobacteraceae bacterium]